MHNTKPENKSRLERQQCFFNDFKFTLGIVASSLRAHCETLKNDAQIEEIISFSRLMLLHHDHLADKRSICRIAEEKGFHIDYFVDSLSDGSEAMRVQMCREHFWQPGYELAFGRDLDTNAILEVCNHGETPIRIVFTN